MDLACPKCILNGEDLLLTHNTIKYWKSYNSWWCTQPIHSHQSPDSSHQSPASSSPKSVEYCFYFIYSKTSDSGPSEIGTVYNRPLYEGHWLRSQIFTLSIVSIHLQSPRRGQPLYKGQKQVNLYCPQCVPCSEVPLYTCECIRYHTYHTYS